MAKNVEVRAALIVMVAAALVCVVAWATCFLCRPAPYVSMLCKDLEAPLQAQHEWQLIYGGKALFSEKAELIVSADGDVEVRGPSLWQTVGAAFEPHERKRISAAATDLIREKRASAIRAALSK